MSNNIVYYRRERPLPEELLVMYRQRAGLTQVTLAEQLGFRGTKMLQLWENGYQLPTAPRLKKLIKFYYGLAIFTAGKEWEEVLELWESVKDAADSRKESLQTYPIFDKRWFEEVTRTLKPTLSLPKFTGNETTSTESLPLYLTHPNNLPSLKLPFIGREKAVTELRHLLQQVRLVTLTGPGGTGKTRLALHLAELCLADFADGVFLIRLASLRNPTLILPEIAQTLGVSEKETANLWQGLVAWLHDRQILLLLDNYEQFLPAVSLVQELLVAAPRLKILVTSRLLLRLPDEREFAVKPLQLPNQLQTNPAKLITNEAIRLFVERARLVQANFIITANNASTVSAICSRLEGLPIAIELAAARLSLFDPPTLLTALVAHSESSQLNLLVGNSATTELTAPHQKTLRATLEWSYLLLSPALQLLFRRVSLFVGGFSLPAATALCQNALNSATEVEQALNQIVSHSLLQKEQTSLSDESYFQMLEIIREYGLEKLNLAGETLDLKRAYCIYYLNLVEEAQKGLRTSQQTVWLNLLEREHSNLRQALDWSLELTEVEQTYRLAVVLSVFWNIRGYIIEGRSRIRHILAQTAFEPPSPLQARLLNNAALLAGKQHDANEALALLSQALEVWKLVGDKQNISMTLNNLGVMAFQQGNLAQAYKLYVECLELKRELGETRGVAMVLNNLGEVLQAEHKFAAASKLYQESFEILESLNDKSNMAIALLNLGKVAAQAGENKPAVKYLTQSLNYLLEVGDKYNVADSLESLVQILVKTKTKEWSLIAQLCSRADSLRQELKAPATPLYQVGYAELTSQLQSKLTSEQWQQNWQIGQTLTLADLKLIIAKIS